MNEENSILERLLAENLQLKRDPHSHGVTYFGANRQDVFAVKLRRQGLRDVRDAMLEQALYLGSTTDKTNRAFVLISLTRSSIERVRGEWAAAKAIMLPNIARRLCLIAIVNGQRVVDPINPEIQAMAERFAGIVAQIEKPKPGQETENQEATWPNAATARRTSTSWKHVEIEKVLLHRWLLRDGPIGMGELQARVGCSYPTVQHAISAMGSAHLIRRRSGGSVELTKYPRERWTGLITAAKQVYTPIAFVDVTGNRSSPEALLRRLYGMRSDALPALGVGGVAAGRHWNPDFDLNGTPRLDLVLHAPAMQKDGKRFDIDFIRRLDPALKPRRGEYSHLSPVLVMHPIHRRESYFSENPDENLPWADPVETILQLNDLGLTVQAGDLISRIREETRTPPITGEGILHG